jgi:hypothetical protein
MRAAQSHALVIYVGCEGDTIGSKDPEGGQRACNLLDGLHVLALTSYTLRLSFLQKLEAKVTEHDPQWVKRGDF